MYFFRDLYIKLNQKLTGCNYNSDFLEEQAIIENIYCEYAKKIDTSNLHKYFWRSVCQYRCQSLARKKVMVFTANVIAFFFLPFLVFLVRPGRKADGNKVSCKYLKINFHTAYQIPGSIKAVTQEKRISGKYLTFRDLIFAFGLFFENRAFYPELLFKFLFWISSVRPHIDICSPEYLIQYCEYSAYSSLRKLFLNNNGILVANVSHGEEFISCRSAFSSFDQYFAWDITPRFIYDAMHMEYAERFSFNPCAGLAPAPTKQVHMTLGFLWPSIEGPDLDCVVAQLNLISCYSAVIVRPHPNPKYANHFGEYRNTLKTEVSDPNKENIHSYIDRCSIISGYLSASLLQAAFRGREVVYLKDAYLASVMAYHEYYQKVNSVDIKELNMLLRGKNRT